jgi:glycosyltransferase involved in cell wall biosynthesis
MQTISIVTPCFNEEANVRECYDAIRALFETELDSYRREHIFCDNASTDRTAEILRELAAADPAVKIIFNARNFGPLRSNYNGVMAATGDAVLLCMVADLQDPPDLIPRFVKYWEQGTEIVFGIRATREEGLIMRTVRRAYYGLLTHVADLRVSPGVGDFQLVDRRVVEAMRQIEDAYPFMRMMTFEIGFTSVGVPYRWVARRRGVSKNTLLRLIDQGMNGLITFTTAPVRLVLFGGFLIATVSIIYAIVVLLINLIMYRELAAPGIATLITAVFFFGGVQLFVTGLIGEYILAIYGQVRKKPLVFERGRVNFSAPDQPSSSKGVADAAEV